MSFLFHKDTDFDRDQIPSEMLQLLANVGYVATGCGKKESAELILKGIIAARPCSEFPYIVCSFMHMVFGEYSEASKLLIEKALKINPASDMAKAFYGLLLYQVGQRGQGSVVLESLKKEGKDTDAVLLADRIIQEG